MSDSLIVTQLPLFPDSCLPPKKTEKQGDLHEAWLHPEQLPTFVRKDSTL